MSWKESLPEDLRGAKELEGITDLSALAKGYIETTGKLSGAIVPPGENATDEERTAFYAKLGRPEAPDKYAIKMPEIEGMKELPQPVLDEIKRVTASAHKLGMNNRQAQEMVTQVVEEFKTAITEAKAENEKLLKPLKDEWGSKYDERLEEANLAVTKLGGNELHQLLADSGVGAHPAMIKLFHKLLPLVSEESPRKGEKHKDIPAGGAEVDLAARMYPAS